MIASRINEDCVPLYFCRQRLKCGVAQTTVGSQMETIGTGTKCLY